MIYLLREIKFVQSLIQLLEFGMDTIFSIPNILMIIDGTKV